MGRITFDRLVAIYRSTSFDDAGDEGEITIADQAMLSDLAEIDEGGATSDEANIVLIAEPPGGLATGVGVRARLGPPQLSIGVLARDLDMLLNTPRARLREPEHYFLIDGGVTRQSAPTPADIESYRRVLTVVSLLGEAAAFVDPARQEMVLFNQGRVVVPIRYVVADIRATDAGEATRLCGFFDDSMHREQKLTLLADVLVSMASGQATPGRLPFILRNLDAANQAIADGYRLFVSEFSYAKIRRDIETAETEYVGRIHKTFVDIQGQLLGIPVATVLVASQMKPVTSCGVDFWTDTAAVTGAWLFVALMLIAVANQWMTLGSVANEIDGQRARMMTDYQAISPQFSPVFRRLRRRVGWHLGGLVLVSLTCLVGASVSSIAFSRIVQVSPVSCFAGHAAPVSRVHPPGAPMGADRSAWKDSAAANSSRPGPTGSEAWGPTVKRGQELQGNGVKAPPSNIQPRRS